MADPFAPLRLEYGSDVAGLRVVHQVAPVGAASFSASYLGPAGWGFDPSGEEGTARAVGQLVTSAVGRFDRIALARRLDRAGATLSYDVTPEAVDLTLWGPADDWEDLLGVLADAVLRPRFDPDDIARVRRQILERQLRETTQPAGRAARELLRLIFPENHPYRLTGLGDRRSVGRLTRSRLAKFHRQHYAGHGGMIVITTAARAPAIDRAVRRSFGSFPETRPPSLTIPALPRSPPRRLEVDLPGRSQVDVRLGGPSIARTSPRFPAAFLANEILGGRPYLSRLFQRVRARGGLVYEASSRLDTMRSGGVWKAQAGTGADRWRKVVPMLEEEVDRLRRMAVSRKELDTIRESAIGEIPLALESTAEAHGLAVEVAYHDLPLDFWLTWPTRLRAVRPRDVADAATIAFERNRSATVIAGPLGSAPPKG